MMKNIYKVTELTESDSYLFDETNGSLWCYDFAFFSSYPRWRTIQTFIGFGNEFKKS